MMTTRPKGTSLVMTMMMMTNIVGQAEYTNLVMMMMSLRRTNNVGQARRHQPSENDDDDNGHGARRQSLVPSFSISHYSSQNSLHKVTAFLTHLRFNQMSLTHLRCHFSLTLLFLRSIHKPMSLCFLPSEGYCMFQHFQNTPFSLGGFVSGGLSLSVPKIFVASD